MFVFICVLCVKLFVSVVYANNNKGFCVCMKYGCLSLHVCIILSDNALYCVNDKLSNKQVPELTGCVYNMVIIWYFTTLIDPSGQLLVVHPTKLCAGPACFIKIGGHYDLL